MNLEEKTLNKEDIHQHFSFVGLVSSSAVHIYIYWKA